MINKDKIIICQVAFTYVGALVGAGFVSGQELLKFFVVFGKSGILGTLIAGALLGVLGCLVVSISAQKKIESYDQLIKQIFGNKLALLIDGIIGITLYLGLAVMLVAGGTLINQLWGVSIWKGYMVTTIIIYLVLLMGREGILWLNTAVVPSLIVLTLGIALLSLKNTDVTVMANTFQVNLVGENWLLAAILYVAYNFILGAVVLSSLGNTSGCGGEKGALLGGAILGLMAAVMSIALANKGIQGINEDIPMLAIADEINPLICWAYSFTLWLAIVTTALGNSFGILKRLQQIITLPRTFCCLLVIVPILPFYRFSFSGMVSFVYPLIGFVGCIFLLIIPIKVFYRKILVLTKR